MASQDACLRLVLELLDQLEAAADPLLPPTQNAAWRALVWIDQDATFSEVQHNSALFLYTYSTSCSFVAEFPFDVHIWGSL